jgi:hypothetical protein
MGSMTVRMMRDARRRLGELTETAYETLDRLAELAEGLGNEDVVDWCDDAVEWLEDTLADDGLPAEDAERLLSELANEASDALRRLQPAHAPASPL